MPFDAEFFEKCALYRKVPVTLPNDPNRLDRGEHYPPIVQQCKNCKSLQTFKSGEIFLDGQAINLRNQALPEGLRSVNLDNLPEGENRTRVMYARSVDGHQLVVNYICAACEQYYIKYMIRILDGGKTVQKTGQYPPVSISLSKYVERLLGDNAELINKGVTCESQGYGIAAFAYYRRIIEILIRTLLEDIRTVFNDDAEREKYSIALDNLRDSQSAANRIAAVKDLIPLSLRPDGINPLSTMYDALSVGLHELNDDDCLDLAIALRETLVYLVESVSLQRDRAKEFKNHIIGLREKIAKLGKSKSDVK